MIDTCSFFRYEKISFDLKDKMILAFFNFIELITDICVKDNFFFLHLHLHFYEIQNKCNYNHLMLCQINEQSTFYLYNINNINFDFKMYYHMIINQSLRSQASRKITLFLYGNYFSELTL